MLFYLFSFLLYICILLLILPIGKTENDGNRGRQKNVDFLRVRLRLYSALRYYYFSIFLGPKVCFLFNHYIFVSPLLPLWLLAPHIRFVFVSFVTTVSINHHKPHAFELVVIVAGGGVAVAVQRNCCAVLRRAVCLSLCVYGNKFAVALGYVFNL